MSDEVFKDWAKYLGPAETPFFNHVPMPSDPFDGLPRKLVKGTNPYQAKLYWAIRESLLWIIDKIENLTGYLDHHADVTFWRKPEWEDHTVVDWDQVSPEERKKRTTFTWHFGGSLMKNTDDPE